MTRSVKREDVDHSVEMVNVPRATLEEIQRSTKDMIDKLRRLEQRLDKARQS